MVDWASMEIFKKDFFKDICVYLGFIIFYIIAYRDVIFEPSLFSALNFAALPTSNSRFYIPGQFYWFPGNLGSVAQPNLANWLPYLFVQISGNNLILAEKLLTSTALISCFTMYFFLSNHFKGSRLARFSAALIFGFGPATVLNSFDFLHWGYAAIPLAFNYLFNILEGKRNIKDILLLGLSLSFMTAFLPQILSLFFLSFFILLVLRILPLKAKFSYLREVLLSFSLSVLVLIITSPYLISGTYHLMITTGWVPASGIISSPNLSSAIQPSLYFATYSNQEIVNTIRLIGGSPGNTLSESNVIGFVLPILAFASLLLIRKGKKMLNLLALTSISLVIIAIIYAIHLKAGWALWLLYYTPANLFYYPERPLYIVTFAYSVMISVTFDSLVKAISHFGQSNHFGANHLISRRNWRRILSVSIIFSLLASVFFFAPVFSVQVHQERYQPLPQVYSSIQNWLNSQSEGDMYRVMFLPTDSFSLTLGFSDVFEYTPGYAHRYTSDYIDFVYNQLITEGTYNLGSLLAPASVKYVILATSDPATISNESTVMRVPLHPEWDLAGPIRYSSEGVQGNSSDMAKLLDKQQDLQLVHVTEDFRVYQNKMCFQKISLFSNALYVVGSEEVLSVLPAVSDFSPNKDMLIFADQNPRLAKELVEASSSVLFLNTDTSNYTQMLSSFIGEGAVYEDVINTVGLKKQLYLFTTDAQAFSKSLTIPSGTWQVACQLPTPLIVDPNMTVIDLHQEYAFRITKENFKSTHASSVDFDLADYYFYTNTGGSYTMTIKGSGSLWAYIAHGSTLSTLATASFNSVDLPDNGTFTIYLPPNTVFAPIITTYDPTVDNSIMNDIDEIIIERTTGDGYPILSIDGIPINNAPVSEDGWLLFEPQHINAGVHNLTMVTTSNSLVAIYNTAKLAEIFGDNDTTNYEFSKLGETSYTIKINPEGPVFISLSESYYPNWLAYSEGTQLVHFTAFIYSNGFYLNKTSDIDVTVTYEPPLLNQVYVIQQILFSAIGILTVISLIVWRIKYRIKSNK